jgi:carboxyl-terminal processing protease
LSEQGRAITVGTKTYGKGSIQKIHNFKNSNFYITNALIYSPSGQLIENNGIKPQICNGVENSCTISDKNDPNKDILLAINLIKNKLG